MRLFYLICIRRALLLLCLLLATAVVYVAVGLGKSAKTVDVETFELPEVLTANDSQTKVYTKPLDIYEVIWTKSLRKDLNPPKVELPKPPPEPKLPVLAGIIFEPNNSFALFLGDKGTMAFKQEKQKIDEFVLTKILPESVKLLLGEKTYEMKLFKKDNK